jgi:hypothetical protein
MDGIYDQRQNNWSSALSLWEDFLTNDKKPIHKWVHYFPIYERHFAPWKNRSLTFLEIGVQNGGSLQMWQRYFGPLAKIVGIDIDGRCTDHQSPGIFVRIGDQADPAFLQSVFDEFGVPDVVLDDGSHHMHHLRQTFDFIYPKMHKNGVYMVEDLHTAYWEEYGGGIDKPESFQNFAKACTDSLNFAHSRGVIPPDVIGKETLSISFYDSIVNFEKGDVWWKDAPVTGYNKPGLHPKERTSAGASPLPAVPEVAVQPVAIVASTPIAGEIQKLEAANDQLRREIDELRSSTSWRFTALPRQISGWFK